MDHSFSGNLSFFLQCDYYAFYLLKKLFEKKPTDNLFYTVWQEPGGLLLGLLSGQQEEPNFQVLGPPPGQKLARFFSPAFRLLRVKMASVTSELLWASQNSPFSFPFCFSFDQPHPHVHVQMLMPHAYMFTCNTYMTQKHVHVNLLNSQHDHDRLTLLTSKFVTINHM